MATRTETLMWTALPNGIASADKIDPSPRMRLSVFLSPRLETSDPSGTLADFPDFFQRAVLGGAGGRTWPEVLSQLSFEVEYWDVGTATRPASKKLVAATVVSAEPEAALWGQFFPGTMPYKRFQFRDLSAVKIKTFPMTGVHTLVKQQYSAVAATPALNYRLPAISKLVNLPNVVNPPLVRVLPTTMRAAASRQANAAAPSSAVPQDPAMTAFEQFHTPYERPAGFTPPPIPPMDFHRALSAIGNYPGLLRRLGLVIDLEVPFVAGVQYRDARAGRAGVAEGLPGRRLPFS